MESKKNLGQLVCEGIDRLEAKAAKVDEMKMELNRLYKMEMEIVQLLAHEVIDGDDKTAVELVKQLLLERPCLQN